jgi:hypothetical protein
VCTLARSDYASLDAIPYHSRFRHFEAGTVDRLAEVRKKLHCTALLYAWFSFVQDALSWAWTRPSELEHSLT